MFSGQILAHHPDLLLARAWIAELGRAGTRTILDLVDQAQALVDQMTGEPEHARHLQGEIDTLRSIEKVIRCLPGVGGSWWAEALIPLD